MPNGRARLHLVEPLGFQSENARLRRASLDHIVFTDILVHNSKDECFQTISIDSVYGTAISGTVLYNTPRYQVGDTIVFGSESVGLPVSVVDKLNFENRVHIPMMPANRSLNISNAVAIIVYEMWRQIGFSGESALEHENQSYFS